MPHFVLKVDADSLNIFFIDADSLIVFFERSSMFHEIWCLKHNVLNGTDGQGYYC